MKAYATLVKALPVLVLLALSGLNGNTWAQTGNDAENEAGNESLYLDALRAISEKRHDEAKLMLNNLIEKMPQHAGAWLELAMLQCELGDKAGADQLLLKMKKSLPLSEEQLQKLELWKPQNCVARTAPKHISVSVDVGYDSNVNQGASNPFFTLGSGADQLQLQLLPEYQPKADRFATLSATISQELSKDGTVGFAQTRLRAYNSLTSFNTMAIAAGVEKPWNWRDYNLRGTSLLSMLTLGGKLYQKQEIVQLRLTPPTTQASPWRFSTVAAFTNVQYPTLGNFDAHTWELRGLLSYEAEKFQLQGSLAYLADRAHADRQGGHRQGYYGNINLRRQLSQRSELELGWSQQHWQSADPYSPILSIDIARRQNIQALRAAVNWYMNDRQTLQLELRSTNNKENISILEYNSKTLQLSWQWQNF